jgi:hypothetical protein
MDRSPFSSPSNLSNNTYCNIYRPPIHDTYHRDINNVNDVRSAPLIQCDMSHCSQPLITNWTLMHSVPQTTDPELKPRPFGAYPKTVDSS